MRLQCFLLLAWLTPAGFGAVCDAVHFAGGTYGFQLSGSPSISGSAKPAVAVGRIVLDAEGGLSGYSSLNFGGWYLGNPVSGTYQFQQDCSLTFRLQDDSGNFQNFAGSLSVDERNGNFQQTDAGANARGTLTKVPQTCGDPDFRPSYRFRLAGHGVGMETGADGAEVAVAGTIEASAGSLTVRAEDPSIPPTSGTYTVGSDCFVELEFPTPSAAAPGPTRKFRGILMNDGADLRGIETDPATAVTLTLNAR
ncbi:MAG TPA: hypothetical protein VJ732_06550 [Bryobacteraceae bacterium]|nr:hypothetical protein [Bryobacteraceae bacterium]